MVLGQFSFLDPVDPRTYRLGLLWLRQAGCYLMLTSVQDSPKYFEMFSQVWAMAATRHKSWGKKCIFESSLNSIWNSQDINSHTLTQAQKVCWLKSECNDRLICYPECPQRAVSPPHTPAPSPEARCTAFTPYTCMSSPLPEQDKTLGPLAEERHGAHCCDSPLLFLVFNCGSWEGLSESQKRMIYWPLSD